MLHRIVFQLQIFSHSYKYTYNSFLSVEEKLIELTVYVVSSAFVVHEHHSQILNSVSYIIVEFVQAIVHTRTPNTLKQIILQRLKEDLDLLI